MSELAMNTRVLVTAVATALSVAACAPGAGVITPPVATEITSPAGGAATALRHLAVKGRAPKTGYSRTQFGPAWADTDRNGCDQRDDVLARDLEQIARRGACVVVTGTLHDPYTGTTIQFTRGRATSGTVQIDHVVALSDAWQTGAQQLTDAERERLATDLLNLQAVDGPTNEAKGDSDAATWLPPNHGFRCRYVALQVAVKTKYRLWVTPAEHNAIAAVLADCPTEPLPN